MSDALVNWDVQLDRCMLNAATILCETTPESFDERCALAGMWMNLADAWLQRQGNEAEFEKWRDDHELEDA